MGETFTVAQGLLFTEMDARAREVVEKKFRVYEELGLLTPAKAEFQAMSKDSKMAQQAAKLLSHVESLRK